MQNKPSASLSDVASRWHVSLGRAFSGVELGAWLATALVFTGWFLLDTFHADLGPASRSLRFFDMPSVIETPSRLFTGVKERGVGTVLFILLCCATLLAPLIPRLLPQRRAWLAMFAPAGLLLACFLLLMARTGGGDVHASEADTIVNDLRHIGWHVLDGARTGMGRRISMASGTYVALLGSLCLVVLGTRGYRNHRT